MKLANLVDEYLNICKSQNNLNEKTIKAYKIDLEQFKSFISDDRKYYRKDTICSYIESLNQSRYSVKTVKRKIATLKAFFAYLTYEDILNYNPFMKIRLRLKEPILLPKTIPITVLEKLFAFVYDEKNHADTNSYRYKFVLRNIVILELLIGTGMRISELCNLKEEDISYSDKTIRIYGKGAKERILPVFNENLWKAMESYQKIFARAGNDYLFINRINNQLSEQSVRNMITQYCKAADISMKITPHMFRHTFATLLLEKDVDSRHIQQLLGHSSITTTQIYTNITSNKKIEIMKHKNPRLKISVNGG